MFEGIKGKIKRLTAEQIRELQIDEAMRITEENVNTMGEIEQILFEEIGELGKHKIKVDQLKSLKQTLIEQNRGLAKVIQNG